MSRLRTMPDQPHVTTWRRIASDECLRNALLRRALILRRIREWFWARGFIEVDAPILAPWAGMEPHILPLSTVVTTPSIGRPTALRLYHQTSPEYALKKLLAAGIPDCFALGHVFRDGEVSALHQPEFTLLEWYRRGADYTALMDDTARVVADLATMLGGSPWISYAGASIDLSPPWERVTVAEAMHRWARVDIEAHPDDEGFRAHAREQEYAWVTDEPWEDLFYKLFLTHVEPNLGFPRPIILHEYPARFGALARRHPERPTVVERFEAYVAGVELCNAFSELVDPDEQRRRFAEDRRRQVGLGRKPLPADEDLLEALAALPPSAGNALGVDRLAMLLLGERDIARVVWFPYDLLVAWAARHEGEA